MAEAGCRSCGSDALEVFLSLGTTPLADALVAPERLGEPEPRFPLDVAFCPACSLVQILEEVPPETLFVDNYAYFSSYSDDLLTHAHRHADELIARRGLGPDSLVVEVGSNDGYLLRRLAARGIPVLGIDPAPDQAAAAQAAGVPTLAAFFDAGLARRLRRQGYRADVIIANNVMAHTPDLNGFVEGMATLLADDGVLTVENPSVRELIEGRQFDTIYHEHFCYFSTTAVDALMRRHGLVLHHVEHFPELHGGTLRWHIRATGHAGPAVRAALDEEHAQGLTTLDYYRDFGDAVQALTRQLGELLRGLKAEGHRVAAYGAAAKGATLLNCAGIGGELLDFVVDRNPHKQGLHLPGTQLPIHDPAVLSQRRPDYLLLLAWNFRDEITRQQHEYVQAGGRFVEPVPTPRVVP